MSETSMVTEKIRIFDTTLRDGEQTPGVALTPEDKLTVAKQLESLGVDAIEVGFPIASQGEQHAASLIADQVSTAELYGLARTAQQDIDAVMKCKLPNIHVFIATSDIHLQHKLRLNREQVLERAISGVEYAKSHGLTVEFSAEDATRTETAYLKQVYEAVEAAKADRINVPDTVGIMTPQNMRNLISELRKTIKIPISVHCHNDFGMAVANSLAGLEAGAQQVHCTINGLGERAGNASLEEIVMALYSLYRVKTRVKTDFLYETSKLVSRLTGVVVQPNKAVVGENAFAHESGIHTHGVVNLPLTYEPLSPELVGRSRLLVAGKHAGAHGVKKELAALGVHPDENQLREIMLRVKDLGDKGKLVTTSDLHTIATLVCGVEAQTPEVVALKELVVVTGSSLTPTATVKLTVEGKDHVVSETGIGPVDAAIKAIQKITDSFVNITLKEYRLEALTGGSDAVAVVAVKVEDKEGNIVSARGAQPDIVRASVEAMVHALNRLLYKRRNVS
ncbi:MAG: 2-isopropylmalate synthase [Candidatus Bathyarchaeia archaeon]